MIIRLLTLVSYALLAVDEIVKTGLDDEWASWGAGFINEERWIRILAGPGTGG